MKKQVMPSFIKQGCDNCIIPIQKLIVLCEHAQSGVKSVNFYVLIQSFIHLCLTDIIILLYYRFYCYFITCRMIGVRK